jgi:ATP diphosphatase
MASQFPKLVELMARLRGPGGCPWDRQQTYDTIKPFLLEETYEVVDAIGRRDWEELSSELGDLLLQVLFFAQMAAEDGHFTIEDVIERIYTKMVRRHPHVFGDARADTAADVLRNWEVLKAEEKRQKLAERGESYKPPESVLEGVSSSIPALMQAYQLSSRAAHVGFDWACLDDLLDKLREETAELEAVVGTANDPSRDSNGSDASANDPSRDQPGSAAPSEALGWREGAVSSVEEEVGDLLFTAINVGRYLRVDPESALRKTNQKFRRRFQWMEAELKKSGKSPREATLAEMDALWERSKEIEAIGW